MVVDSSLVMGEGFFSEVSRINWDKHCLAMLGSPTVEGTKNLVAAEASFFEKMGGYTVTEHAWSAASMGLTARVEETCKMVGQDVTKISDILLYSI